MRDKPNDVRLSREEKDQYVSELREAVAEQRLDTTEFERRIRRVEQAVFARDLDGILSDLPSYPRPGGPVRSLNVSKVVLMSLGTLLLLGAGFLAGTQLTSGGDKLPSEERATEAIEPAAIPVEPERGQDEETPAIEPPPESPQPAATVVPEPTRVPSTATALPDPTPKPTATAAATPLPTPTPKPTATPEPNAVSAFEVGVVGTNTTVSSEAIEQRGPRNLAGLNFSEGIAWGSGGRSFSSERTYSLEFSPLRRYSCFTATIGLTTGSDADAQFNFELIVDEEVIERHTLDRITPVAVQLSGLNEKSFVRIEWTEVNYRHTAYGVVADPLFYVTCD